MGGKGRPDALVCLCGKDMTPTIYCDGEGWRLYWACYEHPGKAKLSTPSVPLPASLAPPVVRLK
jgi:hypothetical protein